MGNIAVRKSLPLRLSGTHSASPEGCDDGQGDSGSAPPQGRVSPKTITGSAVLKGSEFWPSEQALDQSRAQQAPCRCRHGKEGCEPGRRT
jgi:hypothetical protein